MANKPATKDEKLAAQSKYEKGKSIAVIADELGRTVNTIYTWKKAGDWAHPDDRAELEPLGPGEEFADGDIAAAIEDAQQGRARPYRDVIDEINSSGTSSDAELRAELEAAHAKIGDLEGEVVKFKPTVDVSLYLSDPVRWIEETTPEGTDYWVNRAEDEYASDNVERYKSGKPQLNINENPDLLARKIQEIKDKVVAQRELEPTDAPSRTIKLVIDRNGYTTIEQLPYEAQINNVGGSLGDGLIKYTEKGFKIPDPFLCPRKGCYREAAKDGGGHWLYASYCSEKHRFEVEGDARSPLELAATPVVFSGVS